MQVGYMAYKGQGLGWRIADAPPSSPRTAILAYIYSLAPRRASASALPVCVCTVGRSADAPRATALHTFFFRRGSSSSSSSRPTRGERGSLLANGAWGSREPEPKAIRLRSKTLLPARRGSDAIVCAAPSWHAARSRLRPVFHVSLAPPLDGDARDTAAASSRASPPAACSSASISAGAVMIAPRCSSLLSALCSLLSALPGQKTCAGQPWTPASCRPCNGGASEWLVLSLR